MSGDDLPPCDDDVYRDGTLVFQTHSLGAEATERWVRRVAEKSGQRVDWHYAGGRAMVKAIGDLGAVRRAVRELMPEHDAAYREHGKDWYEKYPNDLHPPRPTWWEDESLAQKDTAPRVVPGPNGEVCLVDPEAAAIVRAVQAVGDHLHGPKPKG